MEPGFESLPLLLDNTLTQPRGNPWLQHARLNLAVWAAYGWDDPDPATVGEDTILARLLALNLERSAGVV